MTRAKYYVGHRPYGAGGLTAFASVETPTEASHPQYHRITGPFRTQRAALWMAKCGPGARFDTIAQAEYYAKIDSENLPGGLANYLAGMPRQG